MNIACFNHTCSSCGLNFEAPVLSDFSYGEFIMHSGSGKHDAYLNAIQDPVVNEVKELLQKNSPKHSEKLWEVFSITCDLAPDATVYKIGPRKCPQCNSVLLSHGTSNAGTSVDIPAIAHDAWNALQSEEKFVRIKKAADR